ncbi:MAG: bifunctional phosphoribosyl-AMP cyclohydrolase/phosphoribosyl-ATP diphosphatase HisIE [Armatimonadota bacterium]|nr:bifunctional phosphoribosyl-AMP cyclohydrolase/phosphoribosyl-ATP diphosphatase HisIE [Armatimonadota bacterium]MDR5703193.1 bifunctional phosphoribosyl-AMP cyclohydrolase/phosphoribosyl-ATP diphosphatase HisIE [Armatimonadota bacterium]
MKNPVVEIRFDSNGLIPVIAQEARTGKVLMLAYMNADALRRTQESGDAWYWSRSRQRLWRKGEESGHTQKVQEIRVDCDGDALLLLVKQKGPACHTGQTSCFYRDIEGEVKTPIPATPAPPLLTELENVLKERLRNPRPGSYTSSLFRQGTEAIGAKIVEEAQEVVQAARAEGRQRLIEEAADLVFHTLVLLVFQGVALGEVLDELRRRRR